MKAFLLAAGEGTRLKPITDTTPKCLVPVAEKPLIEYWFDLFVKYGITDVLVNTHHLSEKVERYLRTKKRDGIDISIINEKVLLGSGGTIKANKDFIQGEDSFFICYADNLTTADLRSMIKTHATHKKALTMGVFETDEPCSCGIIEVGEDDTILSFEEKPERPKSNLAAAGIYIARRRIFDYFPEKKIFDLGFDVLHKMIGNMVAHRIREYFLDIGTIANYEKANRDFQV